MVGRRHNETVAEALASARKTVRDIVHDCRWPDVAYLTPASNRASPGPER